MTANTPHHDEPRGGPLGPFLIFVTGTWGTGRHSKFDFDLRIENLGLPPTDDLGEEARDADHKTFLPEISEDLPPREGLDVQLGSQVLRSHGAGDWSIERASRE